MTDDLAEELRRLREQVEALDRRVAAIEEETTVGSSSGDDGQPARSDTDREDTTRSDDASTSVHSHRPSDVEADVVDADSGTEVLRDADAQPPSETEAQPPSETEPATTEPATDDADGGWEQNVGSKWLPLAGAAALVVGAVFLVQVAIDQFSHLARVAIGTAAGLALLGLGRYVAESQGYVRWGRLTAGAGLAITYFSFYAAYGFETYREAIGTPLWAVLLAQTVLVGGAVALSIRDRAPLVAGQSFLLGYATAFLALESGNFLLTPTYVLLLTAGLLGIATVRSWRLQLVASVLPTYLLLGLWVAEADPGPASRAAVGAAAVLLYAAGSYVLATSEPEGDLASFDVAALTLLNGFVGAAFLELAVRDWFPEAPIEGVAVAAVAAVVLAEYVLTDRRPVRRDDAAGSVAVLLAAVAVVLAGGTLASTVGLLAVVCGAVALARRPDGDALTSGAHLVAAGTAYKLLVVDAFQLPALDTAEPVAALTSRAAAFAISIAAFYGLAWWWARIDERLGGTLDRELPGASLYAIAGTGLTVVLLALELSGVGVSVGWALFGLLLVAGGLFRDLRGLRLQGMALLLITTAKVFLFDTSGLDLLARTISFLVLGVILLVTSYAYTRWQNGENVLGGLGEE